MFKIFISLTLFCLLLVIAEARVQLERGLLSNADIESIYQPYTYLFPRGRAVQRKGFEIANDSEDEEDYDEQVMQYDEDDTNVKYQDMEYIRNIKKELTKKQKNHLAQSKAHSGGILVPDGIIEVEGETIFDAKTGQTTLLVPSEALQAIPNGSIVALMENKVMPVDDEETAEERANRVLVRRRKSGARVNVRGGNKRRDGEKRKSQNRNRSRTRRPSAQVLNLDNTYRRRGSRRPSAAAFRPIIVRG